MGLEILACCTLIFILDTYSLNALLEHLWFITLVMHFYYKIGRNYKV